MNLLQAAARLTKKGFHVFPLRPNSKLPQITDFPARATRDHSEILRMWRDPVMGTTQPFNVAISTSRFKENLHLLVVDVDNKGEKKGDDDVLRLEMEGKLFPPTLTQTTPTGGKHFIYYTKIPVAQSVARIAPGIDTRAHGGYIVGAGSSLDGKEYSIDEAEIAEAPEWLVKFTQVSTPKSTKKKVNTDADAARNRAFSYLKATEGSVEGAGGDQRAYTVAANVKDYGVDQVTCLDLMLEIWNEKCRPEWGVDELREKVEHAYRYGKEPQGVKAPEADFKPTPVVNEVANEVVNAVVKDVHPLQKLNKEYAFIIVEGSSHILWETKDAKGNFKAHHLDHKTFHDKLLSQTFVDGNGKSQSLTKMWMSSPTRRSYDGLCFMPGKTCPPQFYNLWRGFSVEPATEQEFIMAPLEDRGMKALQAFLEHARENVCAGDEKLFTWLMGYFAHMIQRPWEKPLTALVFQGGKGVGKNALVGRVAHLVRNHSLLASNKRFLLGNFNGHLENLILFTLDEAFWSGDKAAEGVLKDLVTGDTHLIEHKGKQPYTVDNCLRVAILGNEDWVVPASIDERRYCVFKVGDGRKQDTKFFTDMRVGMEQHGGDRLLLRYLMDFDLTNIDVNTAPKTDALGEQKVESLEPFHQFWMDSLKDGRLAESDFSQDWATAVPKDGVRIAYERYLKRRQIGSRAPTRSAIGKLIFRCLPVLKSQRLSGEEGRNWFYILPELDVARTHFEKFIGHKIDWDSG